MNRINLSLHSISVYLLLSLIFGLNLSAKSNFSDTDYQKHIQKIKAYPPEFFDSNYTVAISKPFILITNLPKKEVYDEWIPTVQWVVGALKKAFFDKNPKDIIEIWMFSDNKLFAKFNNALLNTTIYNNSAGYYSREHKALIMDMSTGGGTLIHEMVHSFVETNFLNCPAWFNEGLGSLYEGSSEKNGMLWGDLNWRLPWLKEMIKAKKLISFKKLTSYNESEFYNDKTMPENYAQARYLLYYLQERDLLIKYYKEFHKNRKLDPTGYESLKKILKVKDLKSFQKRWEKYVMGLGE